MEAIELGTAGGVLMWEQPADKLRPEPGRGTLPGGFPGKSGACPLAGRKVDLPCLQR